jgi:hypothetical protein
MVTSLVEFSKFVLSKMEDGLQVDAVYTDFSKAFHRVNHGLLLGTLTRKFRGLKILWMGSYLTGRTQRVRVGDYLSKTITVILVCLRVAILVLCFLWLTLYMRVSNIDDCRCTQKIIRPVICHMCDQ